MPTSLLAEYGNGGRLVVFNAEYDALPGIGHACGHNLIATGSIAGFLATAAALKSSGLPGRVRLLGTPAEEGGGGKALLVGKGAYEGVDACVMAHPAALHDGYDKKYNGKIYVPHVATTMFTITFKGKASHSAVSPWEGINALDAIVLGYNAVSMLRQQIRSTDRVHGIITEGGLRSNIVPDQCSVNYGVRVATVPEVNALKDRVIRCFEAGAVASGCTMEVEYHCTYASLRPNKIISKVFSEAMETLDLPMLCDLETTEVIPGATDQGNVGCVVPVIHPIYGIEAPPGTSNHTIGFTDAAGADSAFDRTLKVAHGLAQTAWVVLSDDEVATSMKSEFDEEVLARREFIPAGTEYSLITAYDKSAYNQAQSGGIRPTKCVCGHL